MNSGAASGSGGASNAGAAFGGGAGIAGAPTGSGASGGSSSEPCTDPDSDGDGLTDRVEGYMASLPELASDDDHDMVPNYLDPDSDGDGIPDVEEAGPHDACLPGRDTDYDGVPDFRDQDSDDDGAPDADEVLHGLDPRITDTDANGCGDLQELTFGRCDTNDLVLGARCRPERSGTLTLRVNAAIPAGLSDVTLVAEDPHEATVGKAYFQVLGFSPPDSGFVHGEQLSVDPGATVLIDFSVDYVVLSDISGHYRYDVSLESASKGTIASGSVLWIYDQCPKFK